MTVTTTIAVVLGAYLVALFVISVYASTRVRNAEDFIVAGRRLPLSLAWGTLLATWFGAATVLGAAEAARSEGVRGAILDPFATGLSLIVAGLFFAKPMWEMKLLTVGDFYKQKYGTKAEFLSSIILVPGFCGWIAAQFVALAALQSFFFGIDPIWGVVLAAFVVLTYTLLGGMWSVTITDAVQMCVILVTLALLTFVAFQGLGGGNAVDGLERFWSETDSDLLNILPKAGMVATASWLGTFAAGLFGNVPGQDLMQRVFAARSASTARKACFLAGGIYLAFGLLPVALGLISRILVPHETEDNILALLASQFLSPFATVIFVVALVSVIISTSTSAVLAPSVLLGHNLLGKLETFRRRPLFSNRLSVVLVSAASVLVAFSGKSILGLLELTLSVVFVALFVPLLMGIYGKPRGEKSAIAAMLFGVSAWALRELLEGVILPIPSQGNQPPYPDYVFTFCIENGRGIILAHIGYGFSLLPSAIWGVASSFLGYSAGQLIGTHSNTKIANP